MKTYDEYYKISKMYCDKSLKTSESMYGKCWWKNNEKNLTTSQDYDFIKPIIDKNNAPIIKNITNVYNSEWNILHNMLSEMVIDYMMENHINDNLYSYSINMNFDKPNKKWSICLKRSDYESITLPESEPYDFPSYDFVGDEKIINKFDTLNIYMYKCVKHFLNDNDKDVPKIINNVNFSIDDLGSSINSGKLMPSSESSLSVGWDKNGDENVDELLVVSM